MQLGKLAGGRFRSVRPGPFCAVECRKPPQTLGSQTGRCLPRPVGFRAVPPCSATSCAPFVHHTRRASTRGDDPASAPTLREGAFANLLANPLNGGPRRSVGCRDARESLGCRGMWGCLIPASSVLNCCTNCCSRTPRSGTTSARATTAQETPVLGLPMGVASADHRLVCRGR